MSGENKKKFDGPTIIYCQTKKLTSTISDFLCKMGIKSDVYHADLKMSVRKTTQKKFIYDELDVSLMNQKKTNYF